MVINQDQTVQNLLKEIDRQVTAKIPCNLEAPKNQKHRKAVETVMRRYFRNLGAAFPMSKAESLYRRTVKD